MANMISMSVIWMVLYFALAHRFLRPRKKA